MIVQTRKKTPADANALTALAIRSKQSNGYDQAFMDACADELTVTRTAFTHTTYWVAEGPAVCGMVGLRIDADSTGAEVCAFFIDPNWKRKGIGQTLWQVVLDHARAIGLASLRLDADPAAVPFYEAMGCQTVGQVASGSIPDRYLPHMTIALCPA